MSFNVIFYNFSKRKNSTKVPDSAGLNVVCNLKSNTSILTPTLEIYSADESITGYNYIRIVTFNRYYFITDFSWNTGGYWEVTATVDVLGSFKTAIVNTTAFIRYAQTAFNSHIVDTRLQQVTMCSTIVTSGNNQIFNFDGWTDRNILFFVSEYPNLSSGGALQAYLVTESQLKNVCHSLYSASLSVWQDLQAQAGSASACLVKCLRVPYSVPTGGDLPIILGNYTTGVTGRNVIGKMLMPTVQISIPWQTSDFRRAYHKFTLVLPFVGAVKIEASDIINDSTLDIDVAIDILTGDVTYYVSHDTDAVAPIASFKGNCACQLPMSSYQNNTVGGVTSLSLAAMTAASGDLAKAAGELVNSAADFCLSKTPTVIGSLTGAAENMSMPTLITQYYPTSVEPSSIAATLGRPYFAQNSLSGFSGRVQTSGASVASDGIMTTGERNDINILLDSGIYIE